MGRKAKATTFAFETWEQFEDVCAWQKEVLHSALSEVTHFEFEGIFAKICNLCPQSLQSENPTVSGELRDEVLTVIPALSSFLAALVESKSLAVVTSDPKSAERKSGVLPHSLSRLLRMLTGVWLQLPPGADQANLGRTFETIFLSEAEGRSVLSGTLVLYFVLAALSSDATQGDISRVYKLREAMRHLDLADESSAALRGFIVRAFFSSQFLRSEDGRRFLAYCVGSVDACVVEDVFAGLKQQLPAQRARQTMLKSHSSIFYSGWKLAEGGLKLLIEEKIQDLILASIICEPKMAAKCREILNEFHVKRDSAVVDLLARIEQPLLYRYLPVANWKVRFNAVALFAVAFPFGDISMPTTEYEGEIERQYATLLRSLEDVHPEVRRTAVQGVSRVLSAFWEMIPVEKAAALLSALFEKCVKDVNAPAVRAAVLDGLCYVLGNPMSHEALQALLPNLAPLLHDKSVSVRRAMVRLLHRVSTIRDMHYAKVAPLDDIFARLEKDFILANVDAAVEAVRRPSQLLNSAAESAAAQRKLELNRKQGIASPDSVSCALCSLLAESLYSSTDDLVAQFERFMVLANMSPKALVALVIRTSSTELGHLDALRLAVALFNSAARRCRELPSEFHTRFFRKLSLEDRGTDSEKPSDEVVASEAKAACLQRVLLSCVRELVRFGRRKVVEEAPLDAKGKAKGKAKAKGKSKKGTQETQKGGGGGGLADFIETSFGEELFLNLIGTAAEPTAFYDEGLKILSVLKIGVDSMPKVALVLRDLVTNSAAENRSPWTEWCFRDAVLPLATEWGVLGDMLDDLSEDLQIVIRRWSSSAASGEEIDTVPDAEAHFIEGEDEPPPEISAGRGKGRGGRQQTAKRRKIAAKKGAAGKRAGPDGGANVMIGGKQNGSCTDFATEKNLSSARQAVEIWNISLGLSVTRLSLLQNPERRRFLLAMANSFLGAVSLRTTASAFQSPIFADTTIDSNKRSPDTTNSEDYREQLISLFARSLETEQDILPLPPPDALPIRWPFTSSGSTWGTAAARQSLVSSIFTLSVKVALHFAVADQAQHSKKNTTKASKASTMAHSPSALLGLDSEEISMAFEAVLTLESLFESFADAKPLAKVAKDLDELLLLLTALFGGPPDRSQNQRTAEVQVLQETLCESCESVLQLYLQVSMAYAACLSSVDDRSDETADSHSRNRSSAEMSESERLPKRGLAAGTLRLAAYIEAAIRWTAQVAILRMARRHGGSPKSLGQLYQNTWKTMAKMLIAFTFAAEVSLYDLFEAFTTLLRLASPVSPHVASSHGHGMNDKDTELDDDDAIMFVDHSVVEKLITRFHSAFGHTNTFVAGIRQLCGADRGGTQEEQEAEVKSSDREERPQLGPAVQFLVNKIFAQRPADLCETELDPSVGHVREGCVPKYGDACRNRLETRAAQDGENDDETQKTPPAGRHRGGRRRAGSLRSDDPPSSMMAKTSSVVDTEASSSCADADFLSDEEADSSEENRPPVEKRQTGSKNGGTISSSARRPPGLLAALGSTLGSIAEEDEAP